MRICVGLIFGEHGIDGGGGLTAFAHSEDDGGGTEDDIAACEDFWEAGLAVIVGKDVSIAVGFEAWGCCFDQGVRLVADGDDEEVCGEDELAIWDRDGAAAAGGVVGAELIAEAFDGGDAALGVAEDTLGILEEVELDAFLLGVEDFFVAGGHFEQGTAVDEVDFLCTEAEGGTCGIHGDVSAAEDGDAAGGVDGGIGVLGVVGSHEVGAGEVFVGGIDADEVFAFDAHKLGQAGAGSDEDGIEVVFFQQIGQLTRTADDEIVIDLDAHGAEAFELGLNDCFWEAEFWDSVNEDAAAFMEGFEEDDVMAGAADVCGDGDSGGAGADDGDLLAGGGCDGWRGMGVMEAAPVGAEAFDAADGDGLGDIFQGAAHGTIFLALFFLGADAAADGWEEGRFAEDVQGICELSLGGFCQEIWDTDRDGATLDAGGIFTLEATGGFDLGLFGAVAEGDFGHIVASFMRVLFRHWLWGEGHFFLRCHNFSVWGIGRRGGISWGWVFCWFHRMVSAGWGWGRVVGEGGILGLFEAFFEGLQVEAAFFVGEAFLWLEGGEALDHLVEIDLMAIEFGAVDADELGLAADGDAATAAHTGAIDHDGIEGDDGFDVVGLGGIGAELHHEWGSDGDDEVWGWCLFTAFAEGLGDEGFSAEGAVVGAEDEGMGDGAHFGFKDEELSGTGAEDDGEGVTGGFQGLGDGVQGGGADAAADADDGAVIFDLGRAAEWADEVGDRLADVECGELAGGGADDLEDEGDPAFGGVGVGDGEGDALTVVGIELKDDELAWGAFPSDLWGTDAHTEDVWGELVFGEDRVHVGWPSVG